MISQHSAKTMLAVMMLTIETLGEIRAIFLRALEFRKNVNESESTPKLVKFAALEKLGIQRTCTHKYAILAVNL